MEIEITQKQFNDIGTFFKFLSSPSGIIEGFFSRRDGKHFTRFYEDKNTFIKEVVAFNHEGFTCYAGLQPRKPDLLKRSRSGRDDDVIGLRLLYIDLDPIRATGNKGNATEEEKQGCLEGAKWIQKRLKEYYGCEALVICSGNGHWLHFPIPEITITDANRAEMKARLKAWGNLVRDEFQADNFKIDDIYDLRRVTKIPGTKVFNNPDEPGRPQRVAEILSDGLPPQSEELFRRFMALPVSTTDRGYHQSNDQPDSKCDFEALFKKCYALAFLKEKGQSGVSIPHSIRLALATISDKFGDVGNDFAFIRQIIGGCPDFSEEKTQKYLKGNLGKSNPYGCDKIRDLCTEHFADFDPGRCSCNMTPSKDPLTGKLRKPSPVRWAYPKKEELATPPDEIPLTQAQVLIKLSDHAEYFHTPDSQVYATLPINGHLETWAVRSKGFRRWILHEFFLQEGKPPGSQALEDALGTIEARALFTKPEKPVFIRVAAMEEAVYIDLTNGSWEAVEIRKEGWKVITNPPVKFYRTRGVEALPYPISGGSLDSFKAFINAPSPECWVLIGSWIIGSTRPRGPYPILILQGEQGTAKSTSAKLIRSLIDPNISPLRTTPREERDLMIAANNGWVLAFDNLSGLRPWLSDALCRLSTGGGFSTRELYSNDQETIFSAMRPIILNGIDDIATRHDLADRSIVVNLPVIPEARRRSEADLMKEFETVRPYILGALCDAISMGLRNAQSTKLSSLPRMADFALWVSAAEPALPWERGQFVKCYLGNRGDVVDLALDGDQVADAVREMMMNKDAWEGKPSDLLECIEGYASEKAQKGKSWPKAPSALSRALKRSATFLRAVDIEISFLKKDRKRVIAIRKVVQNAVSAVSNTADDSQAHDSNEENGRRHFQQTPSPEGKIPSPPGQIPSPEDDGGNNGTDRNNSSAWNF